VEILVRASKKSSNQQNGSALLESLIAILIFSFGILGMVGMQARSTQLLSDASFRSFAAQHAADLVAEMWTVDPGVRASIYGTGGVRYVQWHERLKTGVAQLPNAGTLAPQVTVNTVETKLNNSTNSFIASDVTITIFWQRIGYPVNQYSTTSRILEPQS
jgi:type IV pilus assembly protein PilV